MPRKTNGRRKIDIVKIGDKKNLQATFSRRRTGIFKKANELSILCGAEIVIIVFSPGRKAFTFGHPSVHTVTESFLTQNTPAQSKLMQHVEDFRSANVHELSMQLAEVQNELEAEKQRSEEITEIMKGKQTQQWWEKPIDELDIPRLQDLKTYLEGLHQIFCRNMGG